MVRLSATGRPDDERMTEVHPLCELEAGDARLVVHPLQSLFLPTAFLYYSNLSLNI